jgi:ArsR family transcriptional regulator
VGKVVQLPQSTVSRHLRVLSDAGWTGRRNEGTATLYRVVLDDLAEPCRSLWVTVREGLAADRLAAELAEDDRRLKSVLAERRLDSRAFFGRVAGQWDDVRNELFGQAFTPTALLGLLRPDWIVADLGCGTGNAAELLAPVVKRVVVVDQSTPMLDAAKQRLEGFANIDFRQGDLEHVPMATAEADAAVCILVLHHLNDPAAACREIRRIVKPGGPALVVDMVEHDRDSYRHTMGHRWLGFSQSTMTGFMSAAGFRDVRYALLPTATEGRGPGLFGCVGYAG